uniref:Uncharacterized protein n=1 Tax=Aegilops tauschii subsp. strangulata TaxID=200361 RepID=A0A453A5R2_AEGTS
ALESDLTWHHPSSSSSVSPTSPAFPFLPCAPIHLSADRFAAPQPRFPRRPRNPDRRPPRRSSEGPGSSVPFSPPQLRFVRSLPSSLDLHGPRPSTRYRHVSST